MPAALHELSRRLLDAPTYATLATVNPDGSPQATIVWVRRDGDDVLMSTVMGRRKERNLRRDPRVSLVFFDPQNPYVYAEIRGRATLSEAGGRELIDELSVKYRGEPYPAEPEGTVRFVFRGPPDRVIER